MKPALPTTSYSLLAGPPVAPAANRSHDFRGAHDATHGSARTFGNPNVSPPPPRRFLRAGAGRTHLPVPGKVLPGPGRPCRSHEAAGRRRAVGDAGQELRLDALL